MFERMFHNRTHNHDRLTRFVTVLIWAFAIYLAPLLLLMVDQSVLKTQFAAKYAPESFWFFVKTIYGPLIDVVGK